MSAALAVETMTLAERATWHESVKRMAAAPERLFRDYTPHGAAAALFDAYEREVCLVGPANSGKSRACLELLHRDAATHHDSRQLIARDTRRSLTQSTMVTLERHVFKPGTFGPAGAGRPIAFHSGKQEYQYPNGSIIAVAGLDDPERLFSSEWDRVYIAEVSEVTLDSYESLLRGLRNKALPRQQLISDMNPTHALHWMHQRCDAGVTRELLATHADNPVITEAELANLAALTGARRERLFLGRRVVDTEGSYYGKLLYEAREDGRMPATLPIDPIRPVYTSWDLGMADFTSIWFWQVSGREFWVIDYYEMSGEGLAHYAKVLQVKGYLYGGHYLPHDGAARIQALKAETTTDMLRQLLPGQPITVVPRVNDISDRIEAVRAILPRCTFDNSVAPPESPEQRNTGRGIQRLLAYKRNYDPTRETFGATPVHDAASHAADSFGTFAMGFKPPQARPAPTLQRFR